MNTPDLITARESEQLSHNLLGYYEAIESASQDMLQAARNGDWDTVVKLEGACAVLIAQLKHASESRVLGRDERALKSRIMQRILFNDAEIRTLTEPWLNDLGRMMGASIDPKKMH